MEANILKSTFPSMGPSEPTISIAVNTDLWAERDRCGQEFQFRPGCARTVAAPYFLELNIDREPEPPTHQTDRKCTLSSL